MSRCPVQGALERRTTFLQARYALGEQNGGAGGHVLPAVEHHAGVGGILFHGHAASSLLLTGEQGRATAHEAIIDEFPRIGEEANESGDQGEVFLGGMGGALTSGHLLFFSSWRQTPYPTLPIGASLPTGANASSIDLVGASGGAMLGRGASPVPLPHSRER